MLVLSRKVGERIHIGNDVFVEIRRIAGSRVTVAVHAPKSVRILRGELVDSATSFEVLDEPATSTAEEDTVIMKNTPVAPTNPLPHSRRTKSRDSRMSPLEPGINRIANLQFKLDGLPTA